MRCVQEVTRCLEEVERGRVKAPGWPPPSLLEVLRQGVLVMALGFSLTSLFRISDSHIGPILG